MSATFAALSWEPALQGILAVAVAVILLMGSVYLLLATNTGARLGMLLALAALFGWMALMGIVWTLYAQGLADMSEEPHWVPIEVNVGELEEAQTERARDLSEWKELPAADPARGEAQASADVALTSSTELFDSSQGYVVTDAYEVGGKPERKGDGIIDRIAHKISSTARIVHPPHYAIVQVQAVVPVEAVPGEAPPTPEADPSQPVISVIMERDLGNVRVRPAVFTIVCFIIFFVLCWMLHVRDKEAARARSAAATSG
ncbi:MAG: hypothetical protein ACRDJP_03285 [Actinomycetota bacterium]